jgi:CDP-L-myo-inositol myo-inositolphosphotransferase
MEGTSERPEQDGAPASHDSKGVAGSDGPISRRLNRPISSRISAHVAGWPVTADQWSYISFASVCTGALAFATHSPRLGAALVHAGSVLDGVDGEVARLQQTSSAQGALLDITLDRASDVALLGGLALGAGGRRIDWLLALAAANGIVTAGVVKERVGHEGVDVAGLQQQEAVDGGLDTLVRYTGRDGRLFAVTLGGLIRQPRLALLWLAATSNWRLIRRLRAARALLRRRDDD